jgi:molybdenum cofactor biosynthesis enzyme MoaA
VDNLNKKYFKQMIELSEEYNATLIILRYLPIMKETGVMGLELNNWHWKRICREARALEQNGYKIEIGFPNKYNPICPAAINRIGISVKGLVKPCIYYNDYLGNILKEPWEQIDTRLKSWRLNNRIPGCVLLHKLNN